MSLVRYHIPTDVRADMLKMLISMSCVIENKQYEWQPHLVRRTAIAGLRLYEHTTWPGGGARHRCRSLFNTQWAIPLVYERGGPQ